MDSASLKSIIPIFEGIDRWVELAPLLPIIISLELVLSADNAVALASITRLLNNKELQNKALNLGITISLCLRVLLILFAQYLLKYWVIKLVAGIYLVFLFLNKLRDNLVDTETAKTKENNNSNIPLINVVFLLALTDLAFSIDSIAAAVAISDQILLVITGALIGVIALRFTSGLFIKWLEDYPRLELAGYIAVGLVGFKLLIYLALPNFLIPEWTFFLIVISLFIWGFTYRSSKFD